jgi:Ser/Thr protein kinase RdoA (MazF antagonist)
MAVYTDIDDITLSALLDEYDLGPPLAFKGIAEGVENSNFLLETPKGRFILTVFEKRAKREDLPFFMGMMGHLSAKGFPAPLPVPAKDGNPLRTVQGKPTHTLSHGVVVYADGDLRAVRGAGQYIKRPPFAPQFAPLARKAALETPVPVAR